MIQTLADALSERGYDTLTAVQEAVTNPDLQEADLLVSAQTGSGKTVGFGLAIAPTLLQGADMLDAPAAPLALIVAPTRELALQVMRELTWLYAKTGARVTSCIGGMDARDERRALDRGTHIVVGTPGRLRDHIERGALNLGSLRAIVLDEADEMLDLGFREDLEFMLGEAPADRRTLLFSATVPPMIANLAQQYQRDAVRVTTLAKGEQHADIAYQALRVAPQDAEHAVINLLRYHDAQNAIVFANTRAMVARLTARLSNRGFSVVSLSGELSQDERTHALQAMRDGRARVCVATDVAARGIDLPGLELVVHAELPSNSETLLHRSGRTGRAGRKGISALIVPPKSTKKAERLLKFAKITAEWGTPPSVEDILRMDEERLLADPVWQAEVTPEQSEFAQKLLDLHGAERIAAAYLALYRSRQSAPEDLSDPGARPERSERPDRPERKERAAFGPSTWFALSIGRNDRAEPRWLLPMLCRAGNIDKTAIGAIRVRDDASFVELSQEAVPGFLEAIGTEGALEDGLLIQQLDQAPDLSEPLRKRRFDSDRPERGPRGADRPDRAPRAPRAPRDAAPYAKPPRDKAPYDKAPKREKPVRRMDEALASGAVTPRGPSKPRPQEDGPAPRSKFKPRAETGDKPARPFGKPKPEGKAYGKPGDKPFAKGPGKPGKPGGKPFGERKSEGKPFGKPAGKPTGKPTGRPDGKPAGKPFAKGPAKPGKPGAKPARKPRVGGFDAPRRPKS